MGQWKKDAGTVGGANKSLAFQGWGPHAAGVPLSAARRKHLISLLRQPEGPPDGSSWLDAVELNWRGVGRRIGEVDGA